MRIKTSRYAKNNQAVHIVLRIPNLWWFVHDSMFDATRNRISCFHSEDSFNVCGVLCKPSSFYVLPCHQWALFESGEVVAILIEFRKRCEAQHLSWFVLLDEKVILRFSHYSM